MIQTALLEQVDTLSRAQLLELIGHAWNRLDTDVLPMTDAETLLIEPAAPERRPGTADA